MVSRASLRLCLTSVESTVVSVHDHPASAWYFFLSQTAHSLYSQNESFFNSRRHRDNSEPIRCSVYKQTIRSFIRKEAHALILSHVRSDQ